MKKKIDEIIDRLDKDIMSGKINDDKTYLHKFAAEVVKGVLPEDREISGGWSSCRLTMLKKAQEIGLEVKG